MCKCLSLYFPEQGFSDLIRIPAGVELEIIDIACCLSSFISQLVPPKVYYVIFQG